MSDANKNNNGTAGRFGMGFASLRERAQEIGSNVASSVNDMNAKVTEAAKKAAASTPNNSMHGGRGAATATTAAGTATAVPVATTPGGERVASASREELVEVLQKMNKKYKALNALRTQLQDKLHITEQERDQLKSMVINSFIMTKRPTHMERSEIMSASIQQLSEVYKEMESLDQKEIQQLKQALNETPPPMKSSNPNVDFAMKEKLLKEEHERAMAVLKENLEDQYKKELLRKDAIIAQIQQQQQQPGASTSAGTAPSTPSGEGSTSEAEDLKTQHAAEIEKLKKAAALQLANFKKKVAVARTTELEKVKRETRELVVQEFQNHAGTGGEEKSTKDNDTSNLAVVEQLKQQHTQELQTLREDLQKQFEEKAEAIRNETTKKLQQEQQTSLQKLQAQQSALEQARQEVQLEATKTLQVQTSQMTEEMSSMKRAHEQEKQRIEHEAAQNLENLRNELQEKAASEATSLQEQVQAQIKEIQDRHQSELFSKEREWNEQTARQVELIKKTYIEMAEQATSSESQSHQLQEHLSILRAQLTEEFNKEKVQLRQSSDAALAEEKSKSLEKIQTMQNDFEAKKQIAINDHETALAQAVEQARLELQNSHSDEMTKLKLDYETGHSNEVQALRQKFSAQAKQFQENAIRKQNEAVEDTKKRVELAVRQELEAKLECLEAQMKEEKQSHEAAITRLKEDSLRELSDAKQIANEVEITSQESLVKLQAAQDEIATIRAQAEKRVEDIEKSKQHELASAESRFQELLATEQEKLNKIHHAELEKLRSNSNVENKQQIEDAVSTALAAKEEEVAKNREEYESLLSQAKEDADSAIGKEIERVKAEIIKEWEKRLQAAAASSSDELKVLRKDYDAKIQEFEEQLKHSESELSTAVQKEKELVGQMADLKFKLSAISDEKDAVLASLMKDGEKMSQNALEESLSKQRESYEHLLTDQKARQDEKLACLQKTIEELSGFRRKFEDLEKTFARSEENSKALETQLSTRVADLEKQRDTLEQELSSTKDKLDDVASKSTEAGNSMKEKTMELSKLLEDSRNELHESNQIRKSEKSEVSKRINELEGQLAGAASKIDELLVSSDATKQAEDRNIALTKELDDSKQQLKEAFAARNRDKEASDSIISDLKNKLSSLKVHQEELSKSSLAEKQLEAKNMSLLTNIKQLEDRLENLTKEKEAEIYKYEETLAAVRSQLEQVENDLASSREQHERYVNESKHSAELTKTASSQEVEKLREAFAAKENEIESLKEEHKVQMSALTQKHSTLQSAHAELENRLKAIVQNQSAESSKQGEALEALRGEMEQAHAEEISKLREEHNTEVGNLKEALQGKDDEIESRIKGELEAQIAKHAKDVEDLKKKMADHVDKMKEQLKNKLKEERDKSQNALEEAEKKDKKREEQLTKLASQRKQMSEAMKKERDEKLGLHRTMKEQKATEQRLTKELDAAKKTLEDTLTDSESTAQSLLAEQDCLRKKAETMEAEAKKSKADRNQQANKVEELSGKLEALTHNLNALAEDLKKKDALLLEAEKHKTKLVSSEKEVAELRQDINKLKLELTKNAQVANRLQAEKEATERNHGQRTAMMGMLESQLAEINEKNSEANAKLEAALYDLSQNDELLKAVEEKLKETEAALKKAQQEKKTAAESLSHAQKGAAKKTAMQVESLQRELQQLQQSSARKSAAAQKMIQEKEAECSALRSVNRKLQEEVDKGSLSDRKIFELAAVQSNREASQHKAVEARDKALARLNHALSERDGELAHAEKRIEEAESQVEELNRIRRREDVNMDYLKSIMVQFLSKPPGTTERAALLPVLATLLQFDANDYRMIEEGKSKVSWWGTVEPKTIGEGTAAASSSTDYFTELTSYLKGAPVTAPTPNAPPPSAAATPRNV